MGRLPNETIQFKTEGKKAFNRYIGTASYPMALRLTKPQRVDMQQNEAPFYIPLVSLAKSGEFEKHGWLTIESFGPVTGFNISYDTDEEIECVVEVYY